MTPPRGLQRPGVAGGSRVVIVEDHELFAESLELAVGVEGYEVHRVSVRDTTSAAVVRAVLALQPRIVLLDLDLGDLGDGVTMIEPLARAGVNVVVVTADEDPARWGDCVRQGARKVLTKTRPLIDVISVVRRLSQGLAVMGSDEREALVLTWIQERRGSEAVRARLARLTPREQAILGHLMAGRTVREIARHSVVSEATVRTQVKSVLAKLEVSSQLAAVGMAHEARWRAPTRLA